MFEQHDITSDGETASGRVATRHHVEVAGRYRARMGTSRDIWIKDISETGCRFFDRYSSLAIGSTVSFRVGNIGPIEAEVRWRERSIVGVRFTQPLYPGVLDHIVRTMDAM